MAVACEGIERDVAEYAEIGKFLLDGAHLLADEIVGIERFRSVFVTQERIGVGKQRYTGGMSPHPALDRGCLALSRARGRARPDRPTAGRRPASTRRVCACCGRQQRTAARSGRPW